MAAAQKKDDKPEELRLEEHYEEMARRYNVPAVDPDMAIEVLDRHIKYFPMIKGPDGVRRPHPAGQHMCLMGEPGVGKSFIILGLAEKHNLGIIELRLSNLDEGVMHGYPTLDTELEKSVDLFLVKTYAKKIKEIADAGKRLTIFFDEANRGGWKLIKTLHSIIDRKIWATHELPKDTLFFAALNPPSEVHNVVDIFGEDAALNRRFALLLVKPNLKSFLKYADTQPSFHPLVKEYFRQPGNAGRLYEVSLMNAGSKYTCPAVIDTFATSLTNYEEEGHSLADLRKDQPTCLLLKTRSGIPFAEDIIKFIIDNAKQLSAQKILDEYETIRPFVRATLEDVVKGKEQMDRTQVIDLADRLARHLRDIKIDVDTSGPQIKNIAMFMSDMPEDILMNFMKTLGEGSEKVVDLGNPDYITKLTIALQAEASARQAFSRVLQSKRETDKTFGREKDQ